MKPTKMCCSNFLKKKAKKEEEPKTASNSVLETGTQEIESEGDAFQSLPQPLHDQTTKTNNQEDQSQALLLQNWPSCSGSNIPEISSALPPEYQYQEKVEEKGKSTASDETREHDDNQTNLHMSSFNPKNPEEWPKKLSDADRQLIVKLGLLSETELNKMANNLSKDKEGHSFPKSLIYSNSLGGREKLPRDWLSATPQLTNCIVHHVDYLFHRPPISVTQVIFQLMKDSTPQKIFGTSCIENYHNMKGA